MINTNYPFSSFFNYVIAGVDIDSETVFIDATESMLLYDQLPDRCINVHALVIKPKSNQWIDINQPEISLSANTLDIRFNDKTDSLRASVITAASAFDGYTFRKIYYGKSDNLVNYLESKKIEPQNLQISNYKNLEKPFTFSYTVNKEVEKSSDKLFIAPFQGLAPSENIFKQTSRSLPVDLIHLSGGEYKSIIHIPDGYKISHLPEAYENNGSYIGINYGINASENAIEVSAKYVFKKNIYEARYYLALKVTFDKIVSLFNEMIVLEKK
jgi:hypothetical protein